LARANRTVAVIEAVSFPRATLSSHIIEADGLAFLDRLSLADELLAAGTTFVNRVDTRMDDIRVQVEWPRRPGDPGGLASIRRTVLDPILSGAAAASGAQVRFLTKAVELLWRDGRVVGVRAEHESGHTELRARLVVGADGRNSTVAGLVGARKYNVEANQRPNYWRYFEGVEFGEPTFINHRWGSRFVLGVPTDSGLYEVIVWPEFDDLDAHGGDLDSLFLDLACSCEPIDDLISRRGVHPVDKLLGAKRWEGFFREAAGPGWVLAGDAGHFKDPGPGRGIGDAFLQAERLAVAIDEALHGSAAELDTAMQSWWRWRDQEFGEHYWLAVDSSASGPPPAVVPEVLRGLHDSGCTDEFFDLINHRRKPSEVLTPSRILRATTRAVARSHGHRRAVVAEVGRLMREDRRRRRLNRRPRYESAAPAKRGNRQPPRH
jgi:flavin-dependent dehydrogenase